MSVRVKRNGVYQTAYAVWAKRAGEYIAALDVFVKRAGAYVRVESADPNVPAPLNGARFANVSQVADGWAGTVAAVASAGLIMTTAYLADAAQGWIEGEVPDSTAAFTLAFDRDPDETLGQTANDFFLEVLPGGAVRTGSNGASTETGVSLAPGPGAKVRLRRNEAMQILAEQSANGGETWSFVANVGSAVSHQYYARLYTTYAGGVSYRVANPRSFGLLTGVAPAVTLSSNAIHGQWVTPNCVASRDGTYDLIASATNGGGIRASKRIRSTGTITEKIIVTNSGEPDDHNLECFVQLPSGRWMAIWNRHSITGTQGFRYAVSATIDGIDFGTPVVVPGGARPSYSQAWLVGSRLWVVYRVGGSADGAWVIRYSDNPDDAVPTWSGEVQITTVAYLQTVVTGSQMRCAMYQHPVSGANHHINVFDIDLTTGDVDSGSGVIGNILTGDGMPVTQSNSRRAVQINTGTSRMFGYDGEAILAMEMADGTSVGTYFRYVRTPGTGLFERQMVCSAGLGFMGGQQGYFGGTCADGPGAILAAVNVGPSIGVGAWELQRWATGDGGDTWTKTHTITAGTGIIARPQVLGALLLWSVMSVYTAYTSFSSRVVIGVRS